MEKSRNNVECDYVYVLSSTGWCGWTYATAAGDGAEKMTVIARSV